MMSAIRVVGQKPANAQARMKCNEIRDVRSPVSSAFIRWRGFYPPFRLSCRLGSATTEFKNWRASPHCGMVNLVRSGRKQPQPNVASAGGKARLLFFESRFFQSKRQHLDFIGRHYVSNIGSSAQMAPQNLRATGGAGACRAGFEQCADAEPFASCLPVHRHARRGQNHHRTHLCQIPELR